MSRIFSEFVITDGATVIDFLAANRTGAGIAITRYTPGRGNLKGGGTWQDSPLAAGRRLVYGTKGNINDAIEFTIAHSNHSAMIQLQQDLDNLLEKAQAYWLSDAQNEPVYIRAQAAGETAYRYALIYNAEFPSYPDPYAQPYIGKGKKFVMEGFILGLERGEWLGNPPGQVTDIEVSHDAHAADSAVFVGNGHSGGLTQIRRFTSTPSAAYSSNLLGGSVPYALFDSAGITAGDTTTAIYFGSPYPFASVVFDIGTQAQNLNMLWEVSNGAGGYTNVTTIGPGGNPLRDDTNSFTTPGLNIVQWYDEASGGLFHFREQALSSFGTMYWARVRFTGAAGSPTAVPTQVNRQPYTAKIPYIDIARSQIAGDLSALATVRLSTKSRFHDAITLPQTVLLGLRSISRGEDFSAYINPNTDDNPAGVSVDLTGTTSHDNPATLGVPTGNSPTGYEVNYDSALGDVLDEIFRINIDSSIVQQYYGRYRLFVKYRLFNGASIDQMRARVKFANSANETVGPIANLEPDGTTLVSLLDLGVITIPPTNALSVTEQVATVTITIDSRCSDNGQLAVYEVVLLPIDEWSAMVTGTTLDELGDFMVDVDSARYPKLDKRAILRNPATGDIIDSFPLVTGQQVSLPANADLRLWILQKNLDAHYGMSALVSVAINSRFHYLRSDQ